MLEFLVLSSADRTPALRRTACLALQLVAASSGGQLHALFERRAADVAEACLLAESCGEFDVHFQEAVRAAAAAVAVCGEQATRSLAKDVQSICDPLECIGLAASLAAEGSACFPAAPSTDSGRSLRVELTQSIPVHSLVGMVHWALEGTACMSEGALVFRAHCTAALVLLVALFGGFGGTAALHCAVDDVLAMACRVLAAPSSQVHQYLVLLLVEQV
jgi:hypothetical protein